MERRDSAEFEFASAMNTVTSFYCHIQAKGVYACVTAMLLFFLLHYDRLSYSHPVIESTVDVSEEWAHDSWLCVDVENVACFYVCVLQALALCRA